ncbi:MAG TPA: MFS transporter [Bryobacteraceae bacterium]|nr:MFS transporter [Bryobacteraceae bacterium]
MNIRHKATQIRLLDCHSAPMRAFHVTWLAFFLCFFGWFGLAPLMPVIRGELHLTKEQVGNSMIASVAITILVRLLAGWLCDRIGPRRTYTGLLVLGSLPVMCVGFAHDYTSFLMFRLAIGAIGASFVITQYHTSVMFAPNIVGTANATAAGWGNLGGGVTQIVMPLLFGAYLRLGAGSWWSWRLAMMTAGVALLLAGVAYYFLTQDTADGDFRELRSTGALKSSRASGAFAEACRDSRVWVLAALYAASFGIELTLDNVAALYFTDYFHLSLTMAGVVAGSFGAMNLFARALGGMVSDRCNRRWGLPGRARLLGFTVFAEGLSMMLFSQMRWLPLAIGSMLLTGLFVKMSNGANYAVVPSVNKRALGAVAGIVGAGGNLGAVLAGFLFKTPRFTYPQALLFLGVIIVALSCLAWTLKFSPAGEAIAEGAIEAAPGRESMEPDWNYISEPGIQ